MFALERVTNSPKRRDRHGVGFIGSVLFITLLSTVSYAGEQPPKYARTIAIPGTDQFSLRFDPRAKARNPERHATSGAAGPWLSLDWQPKDYLRVGVGLGSAQGRDLRVGIGVTLEY